MKPKIEQAIARHIKPKTKKSLAKALTELQRYKQSKANPRW